MGDLAASGGYWISMNADRIYADPSTITGSIDIFGMIPPIPRTLESIGVHTDGVGTTRFAGAFDIPHPLAHEVGQVLPSVLETCYRDVAGRRARARDRTLDQTYEGDQQTEAERAPESDRGEGRGAGRG